MNLIILFTYHYYSVSFCCIRAFIINNNNRNQYDHEEEGEDDVVENNNNHGRDFDGVQEGSGRSIIKTNTTTTTDDDTDGVVGISIDLEWLERIQLLIHFAMTTKSLSKKGFLYQYRKLMKEKVEDIEKVGQCIHSKTLRRVIETWSINSFNYSCLPQTPCSMDIEKFIVWLQKQTKFKMQSDLVKEEVLAYIRYKKKINEIMINMYWPLSSQSNAKEYWNKVKSLYAFVPRVYKVDDKLYGIRPLAGGT